MQGAFDHTHKLIIKTLLLLLINTTTIFIIVVVVIIIIYLRYPFSFEIITDFENKPSPMPLFKRTPQENHIALDKLRAVSSFSFRASLNRPNGLNRSNRYSMTATMWTESKTSSHKLIWNGRRKESSRFLLWSFKGKGASAVLVKVAEPH